MPRNCRANIPRAGSSSGWDRTRISSPIRSRARARSMSSRWCRERGTGRAGARPATPTKSRMRSRAVALAGPGADDDRRRRRLAEMGAVHGARWRRMDRRRDRAARRRRPRHAAVCRAGRRHGDRGRRGAGQMPRRGRRRRRRRRHRRRAASAMRGCAARAWRGCSAPRGRPGGSITSPAPRRSRATSRSRRWAPSACWRGRTGFTTGGREDFARFALNRPRCPTATAAQASRSQAAAPGLCRRALSLRPAATSWHLLRRQASSASLAWPRTADIVVAIGEFGDHRTGNTGFGLRHQALQFRRAGGEDLALRPPAACSRRDRIWRDRRRPTSCCHSSRRSRKAQSQARAAPRRRRGGSMPDMVRAIDHSAFVSRQH